MDLSGRRLGHIRVDRILGQGGMGDVYEGFDEKLMRRVALKALHRDQRLDDEARARLIREARTLSQLDHPNICRIHDYIEGADADVLVLELIEGRTLQKAIEEGLSRAEKLRIAQAIAEVLVVAHRFGIVHRDLKPENVMLTKSGLVKVLDFGLARWIERQQSSGRLKAIKAAPTTRMGPSAPIADTKEGKWHTFDVERTQVLSGAPRGGNGRDLDSDSASYTAAGVTVGTPMYMSPEQARGETLTPASDMYSFGLLLQALFTSTDPYPAEATGREVMLMAARGESLPVKGVNRDIAVLIARLKALAPTDRPTAVEASARLRLIAEKPKRMAQYAAVALLIAAVVAGTWKYIVDVRRERASAVSAQKEAVHRRAQAEDLINFMVGDLRGKLESVGRLEILDDVAQRALAYEASLDADAMSPDELARNAKALNQLGEVRMSQGRLADAEQMFRKALAVSEKALRRAPTNPEVLLANGTTHFWFGNLARVRGDMTTALREIQLYLAAAEQIASRYPANRTYQAERAYGHETVATILEATDLRQALLHHEKAREIQQALLAGDPNDLARQKDLSMTVNHIAFILLRLGDIRGAQRGFEAEHEVNARVLAAAPDDMVVRRRQITNEGYVNLILECLGETDQAIDGRRKEIALWQEQAAHDESDIQLTRNLAVIRGRLAMLLRFRGDLSGSLSEYAAAEALMAKVIERDPQRPGWRGDAAQLVLGRARALMAAHRLPAAAAAIEEAQAQMAHVPPQRVTPTTRAGLLIARGDLLHARGEEAAARAAWSEALSIIDPIAAQSTDPLMIDPRAGLLLRLGRIDDAQPLLARLDEIGYRQPDLMTVRSDAMQRAHRPTPSMSSSAGPSAE